MQAIGYGIIIGALIGIGMFAGAWLISQVRSVPNWQPFNMFGGKDEEEEVMKAAARVQPANYDESPGTAEEEASKYKRHGAFEELKDATKGRT